MTVVALRFVAAIVFRLSKRSRDRFGVVLGFLFGSVLRIRRALVERAMARAGIATTHAPLMYRDLGRGIVDLLWLSRAPRDERDLLLDSVQMDDDAIATLDRAIDRGPVIMFASHTGNWEVAAAFAARHLAKCNRRLAVVAKSFRARGFDAFVTSLRQALGIEIISPKGALASARRLTDAVIVMPIDQVPDRAAHGDLLPFLGESALVDRSPATLAWRSRASVLVFASEREADHPDHLRIRLLDAIEPPASEDSSAVWIRSTTARATAALDAFVRRSPASWLWLHRRWRMPVLSSGPMNSAGVISSSS